MAARRVMAMLGVAAILLVTAVPPQAWRDTFRAGGGPPRAAWRAASLEPVVLERAPAKTVADGREVRSPHAPATVARLHGVFPANRRGRVNPLPTGRFVSPCRFTLQRQHRLAI